MASDVLVTITDAIQNLPAELREKIYKKYISIKNEEKLALGFGFVHAEIESAPFCEENQRITKITSCGNFCRCWKNAWCYLCFKNGKRHFLGNRVDGKFMKCI